MASIGKSTTKPEPKFKETKATETKEPREIEDPKDLEETEETEFPKIDPPLNPEQAANQDEQSAPYDWRDDLLGIGVPRLSWCRVHRKHDDCHDEYGGFGSDGEEDGDDTWETRNFPRQKSSLEDPNYGDY